VTAGPPQSRVGELERRYLSGTFVELCRIESPSGKEGACAERVIAELRGIGVGVEEDDAGAQTGSDSGNLLARIAGAGPGEQAGDAGARRRSVLLCAHLDTVPLQAPVEPVLVDGFWENAGEGILGADNKAAVAVLLALARRIRTQPPALDVELLFTVGEETALAGARAFEASRLRSSLGYVFDHPTPIGEVIVASPSHFRIDATFRGRAAHAGIEPEAGRSAIVAAARSIGSMRLGRLDEHTTANVGTIEGGSAMNVVPERCALVAEVRSLRDARAEEVVAAMVARMQEAANLPECECDVDVSVQRTFSGYELSASRPAIRAAERALQACGHEPVRVVSGGASDANVFNARGLDTVNLANGTERNHEPGERVSERALEDMLEVALALLDEVAVEAPAGRR
jgi:tripeptide aminopeptidase